MDKLRSQLIVNYINTRTYAELSELCEKFHVSKATMRRDLTDLEKRGLIYRVHGGAKKVASEKQLKGIAYDIRSNKAQKEKEDIARFAATLVSPGETVFLDTSTTVAKIAEFLCFSNSKFTVITNDFMIADIVNKSKNIDLIFIGGFTEKEGLYTKGVFAENMLKEMNIDKCFIAFDSIDIDRGITMECLGFVKFKQIALDCSVKKIAVGEHYKFEANPGFQIATLKGIDEIITDSGLDKEIYNSYKNFGIDIIIV